MTSTKVKNTMEALKNLMVNPSVSRKEMVLFVQTQVENDPSLKQVFEPFMMDIDQLAEIEEADRIEAQGKSDIIQTEFEVVDIVAMDKKLKHSFVGVPSREEARFLEDIYYQTQEKRIVIENQIRALKQGFDQDPSDGKGTNNMMFLEWYLYNTALMEKQIAKALEIFSDNNYLSKWAKQITGIGPVISTCLVANLEIKENASGGTDQHAASWWDYCGLNDNNRPWIGKVEATKIVNELLEECGGVIDDNFVYKLSEKTKWKFSHYEAKAKTEKGTWSKDKLISASCIIPYNKNLKVLMYKIGHSFLMCKNKEQSLYGRLLKDRMEYENRMNLEGKYADQAAAILKKKNIGKTTTAYSYYSKGQLPPAHISARCQRYVTKLFISHLFEAAYYNKFGTQAPQPYALLFCGHTDYIGPEVPYDSVKRDQV